MCHSTDRCPSALQAHFLAIMPRIETHARICFRHLRCPHRKEDAVQEVIAISWKWYVRATNLGKDVHTFVSALATYAVRHVRSGRKLCGRERTNSVRTRSVRQEHGFTMSRSLRASTPSGDPYSEALADNTVSPVPDQVQFRLDWPAWLTTRTEREREIIEVMARSERTQDIGRLFGVSPGRVSQMRRTFRDEWERFLGGCEVSNQRTKVEAA